MQKYQKIIVALIISLSITFYKFGKTQKQQHTNLLLHCGNLQRIPSNKNYPYVLLTSVMDSGNIWLRHLIHVYTGFSTASLYNDHELKKHSAEEEFHLARQINNQYCLSHPSSNFVAINAHNTPQEYADNSRYHNCTFDKAILILRSPFEAIVEEYQKVLSNTQDLKLTNNTDNSSYFWSISDQKFSRDRFMGSKFDMFANNMLARWAMMVEQYFLETVHPDNQHHQQKRGTGFQTQNIFMVCYENLIEQPRQNLNHILEFLGLEKFKRPECVGHDIMLGDFLRASRSYSAYSIFKSKPGLRTLFHKRIALVSQLLQNHGAHDCTRYFTYF